MKMNKRTQTGVQVLFSEKMAPFFFMIELVTQFKISINYMKWNGSDAQEIYMKLMPKLRDRINSKWKWSALSLKRPRKRLMAC